MKVASSPYVPVITALFIVAHVLFLKSRELTTINYMHAFGVSVLMSLPLFLTVYFSRCTAGGKKVTIQCLGFLLYPAILLSLFEAGLLNRGFDISIDEFLIFTVLYLLANMGDLGERLSLSGAKVHLKSSMTLSHVTLILLCIVSLVGAFALSSEQTISNVTKNKITINIDSVILNTALFFDLLYQFLIISALVWGLYYINSRWLVKEVLAKHGVFTFFCALSICVLVLAPIVYAVIYMLPVSVDELKPLLAEPFNIYHKTNYQTVLLAFILFTPLILLFEKHKQETQMLQLAEEKHMTELMMLQQQVNPHFLFNTLNNIYAHSLLNSEKTPKLISRLSNMLRYTVYEGQKTKVSLAEELQYLKDFIELQRLRSKENLNLTVSLPETVDQDLTIAPLLLIIILENAFKHSIERTTETCVIHVELKVNQSQLYFCCENTLLTTPDNTLDKGGLGLENLVKRLNLIYPDNHSLTYGKKEQRWRVALSIDLNA